MKRLQPPAWLGMVALYTGLVHGLAFAGAAAVLRPGPQGYSPIESVVPGLLGTIGLFSLLQAAAGLGMLTGKAWGPRVAPGAALGILIVGMLGSGLAILGLLPDYPAAVDALFSGRRPSAWPRP